jgi:hypothetical protein
MALCGKVRSLWVKVSANQNCQTLSGEKCLYQFSINFTKWFAGYTEKIMHDLV